MSVPLLQVALDNFNMADALASAKLLYKEVDVIEVGTLLNLSVGKEAIKIMSTLYENNIICADLKITDAGGELSGMAFDQGADWVTIMCSSENATKAKAVEVAKKFKKEMQVELFGNWTYQEAQTWLDLGIKQVIYHQSRDALNGGASWGYSNMESVKKLADMGFEVSVTGGLTCNVISLFKGINIKAFIVGRNLRQAKNPAQEAKLFKEKINQYWPQ